MIQAAVSSGLSMGEPYNLRSPLRLSNSANEQKLLKIDYDLKIDSGDQPDRVYWQPVGARQLCYCVGYYR